MIIRPAIVADAAQIAEIWNVMITETLATFTTELKTPKGMAERIAAHGNQSGSFVAATGAQISGFVTYGQFRAGPGYRHSMEHSIVLRQHGRQQGTGRALMAAAEAHAAECGHHTMIAGVSSANPDGVAFHAALGYAHVARIPEVGRKNGQWLDLVVMQKIL